MLLSKTFNNGVFYFFKVNKRVLDTSKETLFTMQIIPFNKIFSPEKVIDNLAEVSSRKEFSTKGRFIEKYTAWIRDKFVDKGVYLTTSCTTALEASVRS